MKRSDLRFLLPDPRCAEAVRAFESKGGHEPVTLGPYLVLPGFCDVHVHFREPGYSYKETIATGSMAACRGGYTAVCAMPNLNPVPDGPETLAVELARIRETAVIPVYPYGAITKGEKGGELADLAGMAEHVCAFSDDGRGVQNGELMREAMREAKRLGRLIAAHCEDDALLNGGYIHDGRYAKAHGHPGIPSESEYRQIERDLRLARETGAGYHVCHVSAKESVDLIRKAKAAGLDVTCETAPHYLLLTEDDLQEDGRFKMNPPLRTEADRQALLAGLLDGTVDMIATDHAPHTPEEKSRGLRGSPMGVSGLEVAFPALYTGLVRTGVLSVGKLTQLLSDNPRKRFGIPSDPGWTLFEVETPFTVSAERFVSRGKSTPFDGRTVYGRWLATAVNGRLFTEERKDSYETL